MEQFYGRNWSNSWGFVCSFKRKLLGKILNWSCKRNFKNFASSRNSYLKLFLEFQFTALNWTKNTSILHLLQVDRLIRCNFDWNFHLWVIKYSIMNININLKNFTVRVTLMIKSLCLQFSKKKFHIEIEWIIAQKPHMNLILTYFSCSLWKSTFFT